MTNQSIDWDEMENLKPIDLIGRGEGSNVSTINLISVPIFLIEPVIDDSVK